jgi:hypothetical protein
MSDERLFPAYIPRSEEQKILEEAAKVHADRQSRVVLLYGSGGMGKTSLVRRLSEVGADDPDTVWVPPVDIDDSDYWLLSNLERHVAEHLPVGTEIFGPYLEYLNKLPGYTRPQISYETVVSHLARIKQEFANCYRRFIDESGKTVVISLDTVEAIRGMYLLVTLTQWMKALPATLFILSGRPPSKGGEEGDQLKTELDDPHQPLPVTTIRLREFTWEAALDYLTKSGAYTTPDGESGLSEEEEQARHDEEEEKEKLVHLTRGYPLWLAFAVDYISNQGIPEELAGHSLTELRTELPRADAMTPTGESLHEDFKRRLVAPYHETDFWHEAFKRLAVVREGIDKDGWWELMKDRRPGPEAADVDAAWDELRRYPWIRPRASGHYVTLHDAVAEELAQRIIPLHDQDQHWRRQQWSRAEEIYRQRSVSTDQELSEEVGRLEEELHRWSARGEPGGQPMSAQEESEIIEEAARLEPRRRELSKVKAFRLYYELLCDFGAGCRLFLDLMGEAKDSHNLVFQNLLAAEMQRFLPGDAYSYAFGDAVGEVIEEFHGWLRGDDGRELYLEIGLSMADYLIRNEQPGVALALLVGLSESDASIDQLYRLRNLIGNACMRVPDRVGEGEGHFKRALLDAEGLDTADRQRLIAKAHKELGFYYRNMGKWREADKAYELARDAISYSMLTRVTDEDREEMASIQTNWAYVKGLSGSHVEGLMLIESAIDVRQKLGNRQEEGNSWSVYGEVCRYQRRYFSAWQAYARAERIFQELRNWAWLGLVYQEQAVCAVQAAASGLELVPAPEPSPEEWARQKITVALDLCRDLAVRGYPSALNRAGRIFGATNYDAGLKHLAEGIDWAHRLSDGWFWFANLIEYAELSYRAWAESGDPAYRTRIRDREDEIRRAMTEYVFPDLRGRWELLQGHFGVHDSTDPLDEAGLSQTLEHYKKGFVLIAQRHIGSSGAASIIAELRTLRGLMEKLPAEIRQEWLRELRLAWTGKGAASTLLLARLEILY